MSLCAHCVVSNSDHDRRKQLEFTHFLLGAQHSALGILSHAYNKTLKQVLLSPTYKWRIQGSEKLGNLPEVT